MPPPLSQFLSQKTDTTKALVKPSISSFLQPKKKDEEEDQFPINIKNDIIVKAKSELQKSADIEESPFATSETYFAVRDEWAKILPVEDFDKQFSGQFLSAQDQQKLMFEQPKAEEPTSSPKSPALSKRQLSLPRMSVCSSLTLQQKHSILLLGLL